MSNAEHLIENAIYAMKRGEDVHAAMDSSTNSEMLAESGFDKSDIIRMACHVVFSLYDGKFPE